MERMDDETRGAYCVLPQAAIALRPYLTEHAIRATQSNSACTVLLQTDEITEARAELVRRHRDGPGQLVELGDILEVRPFEADHVMAGALVGFALHVDFADLEAAGLRVEHFLELQRHHFAVLKADDGAEFSRLVRQQEFHRAVTEIARVFRVERNRIRTAQLIPEVFVNERHLEAELFEARGDEVLH